MQIGDQIQVKAYKADGTCYRWWRATIEAIEEDMIITIAPAGKRVEAINGGWISTGAVRTFYWLHKPYSLLEVYTPSDELSTGELNASRLDEIYVNINSLVQVEPGQLSYVDYELDVTLRPPDVARIVDQDEFAEAVVMYGYSVEFQQFCYQAAEEAVHLANQWVAKGMFVL